MNDYQKEQLEALNIVRSGILRLGDEKVHKLTEKISAYMKFRQRVDHFLNKYFSQVCSHTCYRSRTSACCSRDGIITFFADTVVNALLTDWHALDRLETALKRVNPGHRCVYLADDGCMWTVRPVVCAMFLCDQAKSAVFKNAPQTEFEWQSLREQEKTFKWPDRSVLFDDLEKVFLDLGYRSTLMHLNLSPGLLKVKKIAGL